MSGTSSYVALIVMVPILALLGALFLLFSLRIFKVEKRSYSYALLITFIYSGVNTLINIFVTGKISNILLIIFGAIISWLIVAPLVNYKYKIGWSTTTLVWLVWYVFNFILTLLLTAVMVVVLAFIAGLKRD